MIGKGLMLIKVCIFLIIICFGAAPSLFAWTEGFEGDWQSCWSVDGGAWEVGTPTSGPGGAYSGTNCAATNLAGNYGNNVSSRLIRHCPIDVPPAVLQPGLRFWQWFEFFRGGGDYGQIQIRLFGQTEWTVLSTIINSGGGAWTHAYVPLSDYEGQRVEIAFYFHSDPVSQAAGWYIDDVSLEVGPRVFTSPQDWEAGLGDWHVESGSWEIGTPTSGPGSAYSGVNCLGTRLAGNYTANVDARLISPPFVVPDAVQEPGLRFWQWFEFYRGGADYGQVQIRATGETEWTVLSTIINSGGGAWTHAYVPLSDYEGQRVEIAFYFHSDPVSQAAGWYIDDVSLEVGPRVFTSPQDWEAGLGDWHVDSGSWEVGTPTSGPASAYGGANCVGTRLGDVYNNNVGSRLISPPFVICPVVANPALRFWHWFAFYPNGADYGEVQIRVFGDPEWTKLTKYINNSSAVWTNARIPLSTYIGQRVEIAFYFHSDPVSQAAGWYIDDVQLEGLTPLISSAPIGKYLQDDCTASIRISAQDPCGAELYYNWHIPEGCVLTGTDSNVQIQCLGGGTDPYQVTVSVESETSHVASQEKIINIFTQVLYDLDYDGDVDGRDLRQFAGAFAPSELERFALEFGLIACQ